MLRTGAYLPMLNGIIGVEIIVASGLICLMHFATADNANNIIIYVSGYRRVSCWRGLTTSLSNLPHRIRG